MTDSVDRYIADAKFEWARGNVSSAMSYINSALAELEKRQGRYQELLDAERKLRALEAAGVDNWQGYDEAIHDYYYGNGHQ